MTINSSNDTTRICKTLSRRNPPNASGERFECGFGFFATMVKGERQRSSRMEWSRCRYKGFVGMNRWVGLGVIADNLINIGRPMGKQARQ
jgi:hypothetical protein